MRVPERWPPREGRRPALIAGAVIAIVIVAALVVFVATYSQKEPAAATPIVPVAPPAEQ